MNDDLKKDFIKEVHAAARSRYTVDVFADMVRAWSIRENAGVEVFAKQLFVDGKPQSSWTFTGTVDCEKMIFGIIIGGRNKANQIVRFIRNGLLSSRLRLKHKRMNRKAREDANAGEKEGC